MSGVEANTDSRGGGIDEFQKLISREEIWQAWKKFARGKWRQKAAREFWLRLEANLDELYRELAAESYLHGPYAHFTVNDAKRRDIYVARVRDRVAHQLLASHLEKLYQSHFIAHSYAAQRGKGVAAARAYAFGVIRKLQNQGNVWLAKLDVEKYFANINHAILLELLARRVSDNEILILCREIIKSFGENGKGIPLGNLTSQWFANIYLHELDWYAKHALGIRDYMRYNDDIILVGIDEEGLRAWVSAIVKRVSLYLKLTIPSHKVQIVRLREAVDILGFCTDGYRAWARPATVRRAKAALAQKRLRQAPELLETMCSYYGHGIVLYESGEVID